MKVFSIHFISISYKSVLTTMKFAAFALITLALAGTALGQLERDRLCLTGLPVTPGFSIDAVSRSTNF